MSVTRGRTPIDWLVRPPDPSPLSFFREHLKSKCSSEMLSNAFEWDG